MIASATLLIDAFDRIQQAVQGAAEGIPPGELGTQLDGDVYSITWLVWHLTRTQDTEVSNLAGQTPAWVDHNWNERFGLPFDVRATGYGQTPEEASAVGAVPFDLLLGYHEDVHHRTVGYLATLVDADLSRVIDASQTPPITVGVRFVSVVADGLQHAGQLELLRGILKRKGG